MAGAIHDRYHKHHSVGGRYGYTFGSDERLQFFRDALAGRRSILDLGCRDGTLVSRLGLEGASFVGLDIDFVALQAAIHIPGLSVAQANLWSGLPLRTQSVDGVLAGEFLEHCPDPWQVALEVARVLRHDGVFAGSVPNATRLKNRLRFLRGSHIETDRTHLHSFSPSLLRQCLVEAGFTPRVAFRESRFLALSPALMGNTIVFSATKRP